LKYRIRFCCSGYHVSNGTTGVSSNTRLAPAEQQTLMTLWAMARSPLILGANLTALDDATLKLIANRDVLREAIVRLGFKPLACEGSYFLTADISGLTNESDRDFCERLVREAGVALIPLSVFFADGKPDNLVRFAFCKKRAVIDEAVARLEKFFTS